MEEKKVMKLKDLAKLGRDTVFKFPGENKEYIFSYRVNDDEVAIVPKGSIKIVRKTGDLEVEVISEKKKVIIERKEEIPSLLISRRSTVSIILLAFLTMIGIYLIAVALVLRLG